MSSSTALATIIPGASSKNAAAVAATAAAKPATATMASKSKAPVAVSAAVASGATQKKLADFCTRFRGRGLVPSSAASKKRPLGSNTTGKSAKTKKAPEKRPGLEFVNGQMFIRPLEIGGVASDEEEDREEVDEETGMTSTYSSFTDRIRTERWGIEETRRFYKGLQQCGTDFTLMLAQFPGRTQKQLKNKFRKETRERPELVNMALDPRIAKPLNVDPYATAYGSGVVQEDENAPEGNGISDDRTGGDDSGNQNSSDNRSKAATASSSSLSLTKAQGSNSSASIFDSSRDDESDLVTV